MTEKTREIAMKIAPIVGVVALVLGVVGMLAFSGRDVSVEGVISIILAAGGALGLGAASLRNGNGGGGAAGAGGALIIIAAAALLSGCGVIS